MGFFDIVRIFFVLILLLGIMYGLLYLVKKYIYTPGSSSGKSHGIKILSTQMIMPKKFISIIQIIDTVYIIGITDQSLTLLDKTTDKEQFNVPAPEHEKNLLDHIRKSLVRQ